MLSIPTIGIFYARDSAIAVKVEHLRRNGMALCGLLDALDDPSKFEAQRYWHSAVCEPSLVRGAGDDSVIDILRVFAARSASSRHRIDQQRKFWEYLRHAG